MHDIPGCKGWLSFRRYTPCYIVTVQELLHYRDDVARFNIEACQVIVVAVILESPHLHGSRCICMQEHTHRYQQI